MNTITITGRVENDPIRKETNDSVVTTFRLASGRTGNRGPPRWIDIHAWGQPGRHANRSATKGRTLIVTGRRQARTYQNRDSESVTRWYVVATDIEYLDKPAPNARRREATPVEEAC